jgi:uncharacterized protein
VEPFGHVITTVDQLEALYRTPSRLVQHKKRTGLDSGSLALIEQSPFVLIGTTGADGGVDVSPRGGPRGFVRPLDESHLAIPDLNGNNLIDSLRAVVATGAAGLLFVVPGKDETLRVNGAAWVSTDPGVLGRWDDELRRPTTAIVVRADEVFVHCAKAFRRSALWSPDTWSDGASAPDGLDVLVAQGVIPPVDDEVRAAMEAGYADDLAADLPADLPER